ncbi:RWD domain containing protein [Nitzschia inconspicua]|uniref:RWD domain containing protein n=1 Tax=Nitzschia inconspicua TaxID=303405 RepID=A0A9K3PLV9_9STRA|nr:RWD domain containing protein [Nitzschia inconspicua]
MSDEHCEEQEMEAEALSAIFDDCMVIQKDSQPFEWAITLWPEQQAVDDDGDDDDAVDTPINHVGIQVLATIPLDYPELSLPELKIEIKKGLTDEHAQELLELAMEEAENNRGMPVMYAVCERLREWLLENNEKGMDDKSMYAQMMKREKEKEREAQKAKVAYESQKQKEELTEAEAEELAVRKRRAEGTACTDETFAAWKERFDAEMELQRQKEEEADAADTKKKGGKGEKKVVDKTGRLTGFQQFSGKMGTVDWEAMEAANENAQRDEDEDDDDVGDLNVNEELFDVDDEDLDDLDELDFDDDDDEDEDDDDEEEPDI